MLRLCLMLLLAALAGPVGPAAAQSYPARTVKFIVPYGPASGTDIAARLVADRLGARWGKPVVVENRPGGDNLVAINAFLSANDDHTLLFIPAGIFAVQPFEHASLPYDADRDMMPIANATTLVLSAAAPASLNIGTLREMFDLIRANPGKLNAATSAGNADFLISGYLKNNGLDIPKIPYRDILQAPTDLAEGRLQFLMSSFAIVEPLMRANKVKVLAVTSKVRAPNAPEVPTVAEAGYPALELESLVGVFGPRGMPLDLRQRIADDIRAVATDPAVAERLGSTGQIVNVLGPNEFAAEFNALRNKLTGIGKSLGLQPKR